MERSSTSERSYYNWGIPTLPDVLNRSIFGLNFFVKNSKILAHGKGGLRFSQNFDEYSTWGGCGNTVKFRPIERMSKNFKNLKIWKNLQKCSKCSKIWKILKIRLFLKCPPAIARALKKIKKSSNLEKF